MRALEYLDTDRVEVVDCDTPTPGPGEALVRVHACGICGTDIAIATGKHPRARPPLIFGHEFAGDVTAINSADGGATGIQVGDRVTAYPLLFCDECWSCRHGVPHVCRSLRLLGIDCAGAMAEYVAVPLDLLFPFPDTMSFEMGALIEPVAVGMHAATMSGATAADMVVVIGAGPIGLMTAVCLRERGVTRLCITDLQPYRLDLARQLGFDVIDVSSADPVAEIGRLTDGNGADIVFDVAGSASSARQMTDLVRCRGRIVMESCPKSPHEVDLRQINFKEITMIGSRVYERRDFDAAIDMLQRIDLRPIVSHRLPLADGPRGLDLMKAGESVCKVLVTMT